MACPLIVLFVGIPGSGKTTFARQLAKRLDAVILSSDGMRLGMWGSLEAIEQTRGTEEAHKESNRLLFGGLNYATRQVLTAGYSVVYDANANHRHERQEKHDIASEQNGISVVVRMRVPYEVSLERIQSREEGHDTRRIDGERAHQVLDRFTAEIEEPDADERVVEINGQAPFEEQYRQFMYAYEQLLN